MYIAHVIINPRRACAARVTVVVLSFRPSVRLSVTTPSVDMPYYDYRYLSSVCVQRTMREVLI